MLEGQIISPGLFVLRFFSIRMSPKSLCQLSHSPFESLPSPLTVWKHNRVSFMIIFRRRNSVLSTKFSVVPSALASLCKLKGCRLNRLPRQTVIVFILRRNKSGLHRRTCDDIIPLKSDDTLWALASPNGWNAWLFNNTPFTVIGHGGHFGNNKRIRLNDLSTKRPTSQCVVYAEAGEAVRNAKCNAFIRFPSSLLLLMTATNNEDGKWIFLWQNYAKDHFSSIVIVSVNSGKDDFSFNSS